MTFAAANFIEKKACLIIEPVRWTCGRVLDKLSISARKMQYEDKAWHM